MKSLRSELGNQSLTEKIAEVKSQIKAQPANANLRAFLFQLVSLKGDWSAALKQLQPWVALSPIAQPTTTLLEQIVQGEILRQQVMEGKRSPSTILPVAEWQTLLQEALLLDGKGQHDEAYAKRLQAYEQMEIPSGSLTHRLSDKDEKQTTQFNSLIDGDSRFGAICELILNGRYLWLPFNQILEIRFQNPTTSTDLIWRHVAICLKDGREQVCQIPARYPLVGNEQDDFLFGRRTEWSTLTGENHYQGIGQRMFLNETSDYSIFEISQITFSAD